MPKDKEPKAVCEICLKGKPNSLIYGVKMCQECLDRMNHNVKDYFGKLGDK